MDADATAAIEDLLADGWQPIRPSAFPRLIGPILYRRDEGAMRFCFRVEHKHDNTHERAHGGMIMAFCDEALGLTARQAHPGRRLVTIGFECQFLDGGSIGDLVEIAPRITKATASLVFMRGDCMVGSRIVASCSGIWKLVRGRSPGTGGETADDKP